MAAMFGDRGSAPLLSGACVAGLPNLGFCFLASIVDDDPAILTRAALSSHQPGRLQAREGLVVGGEVRCQRDTPLARTQGILRPINSGRCAKVVLYNLTS